MPASDVIRVDAVRLRNVRRFGPDGLQLEGLTPGLNVLARPNEFGKSTILDALKAALFLPARSARAKTLVTQGSDADPYVEVAFSLADKSFLLRKRFAFGRKATLAELSSAVLPAVLKGSDAELKLTELFGTDRAEAGAPSLLWLAQGQGMTPDFSDEQVKTFSGMLGSAVTDIVGGDDTRRVEEKAAEALARIEDKRGKPRGALKDAHETIAEAETQIADSDAKLREAAELSNQVETLGRKLKRLAEPDEERRLVDDLQRAEDEAASARQVVERLGHTEANLRRLEEQLDDKKAALTRFETDLNALNTLVKRLGMADETDTDLSQRYSMAIDQHAAAEKAFAQATAESKAAHASVRKNLVLRQIAAAEAIAHDIAELRKKAQAPAFDQKAFKRWERQQLEAEAQIAADAPLVRLVTGADVSLDGQMLAAGEEAAVTGDGHLLVGDTEIRISAPRRGDAAASLTLAHREIAALLASVNADTVEDALAAEQDRIRAKDSLEARIGELRRLAPEGIDALKAEHADLPDRSGENGDPDAADRAVIRAEEALKQRREALIAVEKAQAKAKAERSASRIEHDALVARLGDAETRHATREDLHAQVERARDQIGAARLTLERLNTDAAASKTKIQAAARIKESIDQRRQERQNAEVELARAQATLSTLLGAGAEEERQAAAEKRDAASKTAERLERQRAALHLLLDTVRSEQAKRREATLAPVTRHLTPMVRYLYGDGSIRFDAKLTTEELERMVGTFSPSQLSQGTQEQIALLTRFAFAKLSADTGGAVPLILDDVFAYADDDRVERLFDLLHEVAEATQVIVLTCRERLFARLGGHRLEPQPFPET
ncbi:MAG: AAA family ATPase [Pseudomonadota bacterium]